MTAEYLAGLIDGEGYLALLPSKVKGLKVESFEPVVKIGMTGQEALLLFEKLQAIYGGHISKRNGRSKGGREVYTYVLKSRAKVLKLLTDIEPHLHIKYDQAILLSKFCQLPSSHTRYGRFDPEVPGIKRIIYDTLKQLKQPPAETE